jgi:hypothetical protein
MKSMHVKENIFYFGKLEFIFIGKQRPSLLPKSFLLYYDIFKIVSSYHKIECEITIIKFYAIVYLNLKLNLICNS